MKSSFLIAAATSGAGKTTLTMGLLRMLSRQGLRVQPFKCGPDYIDTQFHAIAAGRPSVNLDPWMQGEEEMRQIYNRYAREADVCVVEGAMGLFDGYDRDRGSAAEVARLLRLPVVLVVAARSAAFSVSPLLHGFKHFDERILLAGVIFNEVGSPRHEAMLRQAAEAAGIPCLGCVGRDAELQMPSRHLGLTLTEREQMEAMANRVADRLEGIKLMDLDLIPEPSLPVEVAGDEVGKRVGEASPHCFYVACDACFSFCYQTTLDALGELGEVRFFSPLAGDAIPDDAAFIYLPGGYPELFLSELASSSATMASLRGHAKRGTPILAECGGMMYLGRCIVNAEGQRFPLCNLLPLESTMEGARLHLGYRTIAESQEPALLGLRGHEFHYSRLSSCCLNAIARQQRPTGEATDTLLMRHGSILAGYTHWFWTAPRLRQLIGLPLAQEHPSASSSSSAPSSRLRPVMLAGTGSDVGKSVLATALCRIFLKEGYHPAPFKAQNMALNSYATPEGLEIGRAQAVQAEAAGIPCHTDMNPLLLKPSGERTSQVVLHGRPLGNSEAYDYFRHSAEREVLRREVCAAFDRLAARYNPIVMEGAGSVCELNLMATDLVNMPMARHADARVILVADIDRGGVFASAYGSIMLQAPEDRRRICGIIVNKFRGDLRLFDEGRRILERICGVPVLGVIPAFTDIHIDAEDSVALSAKRHSLRASADAAQVRVAVVLLRRISNFTDFDRLEADPRVELFYTNNPRELQQADIIILPGTKATLADLADLRQNGCAEAILRAHRRGAAVVGICGGYQMMGLTVADPDGVEGAPSELPGLGLLPVETVMTADKVTRQVQFRLADGGLTDCTGYEIHQGRTQPSTMNPQPTCQLVSLSTCQLTIGSPLCQSEEPMDNGCRVDDLTWGTYIHGILDNAEVIDRLIAPFVSSTTPEEASLDYATWKDRQYDLLAEHVRKHLDMEALYKALRN